jgi:hypothetical protein
MLKMETQFERCLSAVFVYPVRLVTWNIGANTVLRYIYPPVLQWHHCHKGNDLPRRSGSDRRVKAPTEPPSGIQVELEKRGFVKDGHIVNLRSG